MYYSCDDENYHIVVSGLNRKKATPYIIANGGFSFFKKNMYIPPEHTGKSTHSYIDDYYSIDLVDYMGITSHCEQTHYIHLEEQEYNLSIHKLFEKYLDGEDEAGQNYENDRKVLRIR